MRYRCVEKYRCRYSIRMMCRLLHLGVSGYYAWRNRLPRRRSQANEGLKRAITRIYRHSGAVYGSPKIRQSLLAQGQRIGRHRVARLMRALGRGVAPLSTKEAPYPSRGNRSECQESPESGFSSPCPPSTLGFGYHLYPHGGRLALPGGHHGPLFPEDCRLVTGSTAHHFPGHPGL